MSKIEDIIVDLIINNGTFYASLISQMRQIQELKDPNFTMGVAIKDGRILLKYNPNFIKPFPMKASKAILEHECLHLVNEHHLRAKNRDKDIWKVATDVAINQLVKDMPEGSMTIKTIFEDKAYNIRQNESAEYYYDQINADKKAKERAKEIVNQGNHGNCGEDFKDEGLAQSMGDDLNNEVMKQAIQEAAKTAKAQGNLPSHIESLIEEMFKPPKISWKQLLKRFVANSIKSGTKASWKRPSRRYGDQQKGRIADRTISLVVAIDTSGSIDDGMLTEFINEVKAIQSSYKSIITVLECDAEIQKEYRLNRFQKLDKNVKGRGGTDFRPVFDHIKKKSIRCDALIFFTDLQGTFPKQKPCYPVVWGYYKTGWGGSDDKAPFGVTLRLEQENVKGR